MMMPLLVFAIIALYLVGQIGSLAIKGSDIDVETVAYGTIDTPEVYTGLILREEYVVDSTETDSRIISIRRGTMCRRAQWSAR